MEKGERFRRKIIFISVNTVLIIFISVNTGEGHRILYLCMCLAESNLEAILALPRIQAL